jgi:hypothetical protein
MMAGRLVSSLVTILLLLGSGYLNSCSEAPQGEPSQVIGKVELYSFTPDQKHLLSNAQPFTLPPSTSLADALDRLGGHLAHTYFQKTYTNKETGIRFEVLHIDMIVTPSRPLRIATVNMVDPDRDAMGYFFQGSAGARTTFYMLGATFLQPHLDPPLIDGLVLLYNGEILQELDHINLAGILTPPMVHPVAKRAIAGSTR